MTTPKQLDKLRRENCWGIQKLADAIYDVTRVRLSDRTIRRFLERSHRPSDETQMVIDKFMTASQGVSR